MFPKTTFKALLVSKLMHFKSIKYPFKNSPWRNLIVLRSRFKGTMDQFLEEYDTFDKYDKDYIMGNVSLLPLFKEIKMKQLSQTYKE